MAGLPPVEQRTFVSAYERALAVRPDEVAQVDPSGSWTWASSFERATRDQGVGPGVWDREAAGIVLRRGS